MLGLLFVVRCSSGKESARMDAAMQCSITKLSDVLVDVYRVGER
jgi:hypothetical protein